MRCTLELPTNPLRYVPLLGIGRGGMGRIDLALAVGVPGAEQLVALKRLRETDHQADEDRAALVWEARLSARLSHPNVVATLDLDELDGELMVVLEYLEGAPLSVLARAYEGTATGFPIPILLRVVRDALAGLAHAHELVDYDGKPLGIVHRDVSPSNIFVTSTGITKVLDFGIAKVMIQDELMAETVQGAVFGTPEYMSPEAARGEDVDLRADVYSLGVILFDMLCGRPPFEAPQSSEVLSMHIHTPPPNPREFAPHREITQMAEDLILKAMQKDANKRYQNMGEFRRDLAQAYGSISYRRHGGPADPGALPQGTPPPPVGPRGEEARAPKKRLTEELDEWIMQDESGLSVEQARKLAQVDTAETAFTPASMTPHEAESLANALDRALDDDE